VALLQVLPLFVPLLFGDCHVAHDPSVPQWIMLLTSTPLTINNDPLVVPLCNETNLFISQSLKEKIWGLQYINLALLLHQNVDVPSEPKMNSLTVLNGVDHLMHHLQ
jgi:hypothetical protein